jgi:hypothetical protein
MKKVDLTKTDKAYYTAKTEPHIVEIGACRYLSIVGKGDPSEEMFSKNIAALYSTAYTIKFQMKEKQMDFVVPKLEGLWWFDEIRFPNQTIESSAVEVPRSEWEYRLLIRIPDFVTKEDVESGKELALKKKKDVKVKDVEYLEMNEGTSVQMMHIGPFSTERESLRQIEAFMNGHHLKRGGHHHEIYLSDFRKTAPDKLKTILREPFVK